MGDNDWTVYAIPIIVLAGGLLAQWLARSAEPRQLQNLKLLSDVVNDYDTDDPGKDELIEARERFARKVARNFAKRPEHVEVLGVIRRVLVLSVVVLWVTYLLTRVVAPNFGVAFFFVLSAVATALAIIAAFAEAELFRRWRNGVDENGA